MCKSLTAGLFPNAVYLHHTGIYKTVRGDIELYIHPNSVLYTIQQPQWLVLLKINVKYFVMKYFPFLGLYFVIFFTRIKLT